MIAQERRHCLKGYVEQRLKELRNEMDIGQKQLAALEARTGDLKSTLFRIGGAIQVLEDVLTHAAAGSGDAPADPTRPAS
jgi:prefoldin subunit 5